MTVQNVGAGNERGTDTQALLAALRLHNCIVCKLISLLWTHLGEFKDSKVELHTQFQDSHYLVKLCLKKKETNKRMGNRPVEEGGCERADGPELRRLRGIAGDSDLRLDVSKRRSQMGEPRSGPYNKTSGAYPLSSA